MRRRLLRSTTNAQIETPNAQPRLAAAALVATALLLALAMTQSGRISLLLAAHNQRAEDTPAHAHVSGTGGSAPLMARAHAVTTQPVGYWHDTQVDTTYSAGLIPNSDGFASYTFVLPTSSQITSTARLVQLPDGSYAEGTGVTNSKVAAAIATSLDAGSVPDIRQQGTLVSDTTVPIGYFFFGHISADGLAAYATFTVTCSRFTCPGNVTSKEITYQLSVGCTPTSCTDLASQAAPSVTTYDNAVLKADWNTVWKSTSQQITAQYPEPEFVASITSQIQSVGRITSISAPLAPPAVQFTPEGQAYFSVDQMITVEHNGSSSTKTETSYYLLESGEWQFWFSA